MFVNAASTVKEVAIDIPGATRVFEQMGIDYCCGGGRTLAEACEKLSVPLDELVRSLEAIVKPGDNTPDWRSVPMAALSAHIVDTHHDFTKRELARLEKLLDKVSSRHGANHPELTRLKELFLALKQELLPHMLKEEQVLFPYIERMEQAVNAGREVQPPFFVSVRNPVRMMMTEHETAGDLLREMRHVADNYVPPPDACISFQTLYQALGELETDLHQHIHLENNILFPRAIEMESAAEPAWQTSGPEPGEHRCFGH